MLAKVGNSKSSASYAECLRKFPSFSAYQGVPAEKHRVFVLSVDLMHQRGKTPWSDMSAPDEKVLEETCKFLETCRGSVDVVVAWNGCQRGQVRRRLEDTIGNMTCSAEVMIVYSSSWNSWIKKKYVFASENIKTGFVAMPISRGKIAVKNRAAGVRESGSQQGACHEGSSHWTTMSGVQLPARTSLPRRSPDDKSKIFGEKTSDIPKKWIDAVVAGVPLFWSESKGVSTWIQLLSDVNADCVVDLTPGSGLLATACLHIGKPYLGMVANATHLNWLTNVLDRAALTFIVQSGHVLYQDDLASRVKELFQDLLGLNDQAVEDDFETDNEEEAQT